MDISAYQKSVDQWIKSFGVRYFSELTNMAILTEEVGELSRLLARQFGDQSFKRKEDKENVMNNIGDEMSDIIFVVTCLANQMGINLEEAIQDNFKKKTERDNLRHKNNPKLQSE